MRGRIIKALTSGAMSEKMLRDAVNADERFIPALDALVSEGMIARQNSKWCLTGGGDA
jgi:predicted transcriptional regulator